MIKEKVEVFKPMLTEQNILDGLCRKDEELCLRCEEPVKGGIPYEDGFYCNSCVGYFEAKADSMIDDETDREQEKNAGIETEL